MKKTFIRKLNPIEQAFTISNDAAPLCVVCTLHLTSGPAIPVVRQALDQLQCRHPFLQSSIKKNKGGYIFERMNPAPPIYLRIIDRQDSGTWRSAAENALNAGVPKSGPLMQCWYVAAPDQAESELLVSLHHAIVDGVAARLILHELLSLCGGLSLPPPKPMAAAPAFSSPAENGNGLARFIQFAGRQFKDEWQFRKTGIAASPPARSENAVISFRLSPAVTRKLSLRIGRKGLSLNSVLLAVMAQVVYRHRHQKRKMGRARVISFTDLRTSLLSPVSDQELGCYISMLRLSVPLSSEQPVLETARFIRKGLFQASRRQEIFTMARISRHLIRMVFLFQNMRLGLTALSFLGKLNLERSYGPIQLHDVKAFITNNRFGPELSAFGKVLFGSLGLDFTYLNSEMEVEQARRIVHEIRERLEKLANLP